MERIDLCKNFIAKSLELYFSQTDLDIKFVYANRNVDIFIHNGSIRLLLVTISSSNELKFWTDVSEHSL